MKDCRGATAAAVRHAITKEFGLQIPNSRKKLKITDILDWKKSARVKECYRMLYNENHDSIANITRTAFSTMPLDDKAIFNKIYVYTAAVCDIILNPSYPDLECSKKALERRLQVFKVNFFIIN